MDTPVFIPHEYATRPSMAEYVEAVRSGYEQRGRGALTDPRTQYVSEELAGKLASYSVVFPESGIAGGCIYTAGFAEKDARILAVLFDANSGELLAILDSSRMNPHKTGAAGGIAADVLARGNASIIGVIGSGEQAYAQLEACLEVRDIDAVGVYSPTQSHRERFAIDVQEEFDVRADAVSSNRAACEGADIIITATTASEPVIQYHHVEPGTHINAVGVYDPERRELDTATVANAKYVPDLRERSFQDSGEFLQALDEGGIERDHIHAELGEVVAETALGREHEDELTLFDSGGTAIETIAAAALVYDEIDDSEELQTFELATANETFTRYAGSHLDASEE